MSGRPRAPSTARFHVFFLRTQPYRVPTEVQNWCSFIHMRCVYVVLKHDSFTGLYVAAFHTENRMCRHPLHFTEHKKSSVRICSISNTKLFFLCFKLPLSLGGKKRTEERRWKGRCSKYRYSPTVVTEQAAILRSASLWPALVGAYLNMTILQKLIQY